MSCDICKFQSNYWVSVMDYESVYQVNPCGYVHSIDRNIMTCIGDTFFKGVLISPYISRDGYKAIKLNKDGKRKGIYIHRLIAITFLENEKKKRTVNHIDGNKLHNCVKNLEWNTHKENIGHALENGLIYKSRSKLNPNDIREIRGMIDNGDKIVEIAKLYNLSLASIYNIKKGKTWSDVE